MSRVASPALFALLLTAAACGGTVVFDEPGSGGTGGRGDGGGSSTASNASSAGPTSVAVGQSAASTSSGEPVSTVVTVSAVVGTPTVGICGSGVTLFSGTYDACLADACCDAFFQCTRQGEDILGCQNCLDGFGGECREALDCAESCLPSGPACNSGIVTGDDEIQACIDDACCAEQLFCTSGGPRLDDCTECFDAGGGPRCDPFLGCFFANCDTGANQICDSGVSAGTPEANQCLSQNCCDEFRACTSGGEDLEACIDCFDQGSGPLCDAAIACNDRFGCFDSGGG